MTELTKFCFYINKEMKDKLRKVKYMYNKDMSDFIRFSINKELENWKL